MLNKNINRISLSDYQELVTNRVPESKTMEYKQVLLLNTDKDKKEFLADASAFANSEGGDLIYGIIENHGIPVSIPGITMINPDSIILQIESLLRDGIDPRICNVTINTCPIGSNHILHIHVPKDLQRIHQVTLKDHFKFYARNSNGKYIMRTEDIENEMHLRSVSKLKIKSFLDDRLEIIILNKAPVILHSNGKIALHLIPIPNFTHQVSINLNDTNEFYKIPPLGGGNRTPRRNFEGLLSASLAPGQTSYDNYLQIFRTGVMETVNSEFFFPYQKELRMVVSKGCNYEVEIVKTIDQYLRVFKNNKVELPAYLFLSFLGVKDYYIVSDKTRYVFNEIKRLDKTDIKFDPLEIEFYDQDLPTLLKPYFDILWNACGFERSYNYDESGKWMPL
jgi:Putative DNA-binding domain